jgi:hypothetical protein
MRKMQSFFADYGALIAPIAAIVNGFIAVIVAQFFKDHLLAKVLLVVAAGVLGAAAIGATIYSQRQLLATRSAEQRDRVAMKDLVRDGVTEGEALDNNWSDKEAVSFKHETNLWTNKMGHLIEDAYGKGEATLFMSDAGFTSYTDGRKQTEIRYWIIHRLQRLNDLVPRVDMLAMQPGFDPKNYHWVKDCPDCK